MENPKLSIVTPSYNQVDYIERTILSVIDQSYTNTELIIIDGGSTDGSLDIIKKYEDRIAYWISEKDNGQTEAINKGFRKVTGDFVCFQNSDDIFYPGALKIYADEIVRHPKKDIFYGDIKHIDKDDNVMDIHRLL